MDTLATVDDLIDRLEWTLDSDEERAAIGALEDLSDDARFYGSDVWQDQATAPAQVQRLVLKAAARWMRNPDGYTQSRAGDETLAWGNRGEASGSPTFTENEIKMLVALAGRSKIHSVEVQAWGTKPAETTGYVPTGQKSFPFFADEYI
jgi:hypothetical protein